MLIRLPRSLLAVALGLLVASCGGDSPAAPTPTAPTTPAPPSTPLPATFTLSGTVSESFPTASVRLAGARIEVFDNVTHAGKFAIADGNGTFSIPGLSGEMNIKTSAIGYADDVRGQNLNQNRTASIGLNPVPTSVDRTLTGSLSGGDSQTCTDGLFIKPCRRVAVNVHNGGVLTARLGWGGGSGDLDLTLWNGSTLVASSRGVGSSESISSNVSSGAYELRITYYGGANIVNYDLRLTHPN